VQLIDGKFELRSVFVLEIADVDADDSITAEHPAILKHDRSDDAPTVVDTDLGAGRRRRLL
jgi:hypothetical protein